MIKLVLTTIFIVLFFGASLFSQSSSYSHPRDVKIDDLSDSQINAIIKRAQKSGLSESQLEALAIQKGFSQSQLVKLKSRISELNANDEAIDIRSNRQRNNRISTNKLNEGFQTKGISEIFGLSFFQNPNGYQEFYTPVNIPTPVDYVLGPGDEVIIDIYGASEITYNELISPDGQIFISGIGPIDLAGLNIRQAEKKLFNKLTSIYSGLKSNDPNTYIQVTLGKIRTITVNVVGQVVTPGSHNLSSFSNIFNAIHKAGGPTEKGSMRRIRLIRGLVEVEVFDIYKYLFEPAKAGSLRLREGDIIVIDTYQNRVSLSGAVKNQSKFELLPNETLEDLFKYSGGFSGDAYRENIQLVRIDENMKSVLTVSKEKFGSVTLQNGDSIYIGKVVDRFSNRVQINGAVYRPGNFELMQNMHLSELIDKAEGLKEDAFLERANILRLKNDGSLTNISFHVGKVLDGIEDVLLEPEDKVFIQSIFDIQEKQSVQISGEVRKPGIYDFAERMTLEDLILKSGGFTESANRSLVEVARQQYSTRESSFSMESLVLGIRENLEIPVSEFSFDLKPFDVVLVKQAEDYQEPKLVKIEGEVLHPGFYALTSKDNRVSDLIRKAGGVKNFANIGEASIIRKTDYDTTDVRSDFLESQKFQNEVIRQIGEGLKLAALNTVDGRQRIGINLTEILSKPQTSSDFLLENSDILSIPKKDETIRVLGSVFNPNVLIYNSNMNTKKSIQLAGGFTSDAKRNRVYTIYQNGESLGTKNFMGFRKYPSLRPGAVVFVPVKKSKSISIEKVLGITSAVASIALLVDRLAN